MEKEELRTNIDEALGSTQLQLSEQTWDKYLTRTVAGIKDDAEVTDEFITGEVEWLKTLNGQLHADVAKENNAYKAALEAKYKANGSTGSAGSAGTAAGAAGAAGGESEALAQMRKELDELKAERAAAKDAATKKELLDSVEKGLKDKLKAAGIEANGYFIKQVKKELEIPKSDGDTSPDVDELVGKAEKAYFKSLKEAGLEATASPQGGRKNGKGGSSAVDAYFKKKGLKEGWKK